MAAITKVQLVNFLKSLNLDLSHFPDLSFDGICEEPSLKPFLLWFYSSFDEANVITDDEAESLASLQDSDYDNFSNSTQRERLENNDVEMFQDILSALERKQNKSEGMLTDLKLLYDELLKTQLKLGQAVINNASKWMVNFENMDEAHETELKKTVDYFLSIQPSLPNLREMNEESSKLSKELDDFYNSTFDCVKKRIDSQAETEIINLDGVLVESQIAETSSACRLKNAQNWLNEPKIKEWEQIENEVSDESDAKQIVQRKRRAREANHLKSKIAYNNYFQSVLKLNRDLIVDSYILSLISRAFIEKRQNAADELTTILTSFISNLKNESDSLKKLIISISNEGDEEKTAIVLKTEPCDYKFHLNSILETLKSEHTNTKTFHKDVETILTSFRCGPTLRFNFLPVDLLRSMLDCQSLRNSLSKELRNLAGCYTEQKQKNAKNQERSQDLLWVAFLSLASGNSSTMLRNE